MSMNSKTEHLGINLVDTALFLLATLLAFWVGYASRNFIDIRLYDESNYLHGGIRLGDGILPSAENAPLYACWYFLLHLLTGEAVSTYYINYAVLSACGTGLIYAFLRVYQIGRASSLGWAAAYMVSEANIPSWPKVSTFALLLILSASIALAIWESTLLRLSTILILTSLITFIRPEFAFGWIAVLLYGIYHLIDCLAKSKHIRNTDLYIFLLSIGFGICLLAFFGNPLQGSRSFIAFGQHYSLNYVSWHGLDLNPWTNWIDITKSIYGDVDTIGGALRANPLAFFRHIFTNLASLPSLIIALINPSLLIATSCSHPILKIFCLRLTHLLTPIELVIIGSALLIPLLIKTRRSRRFRIKDALEKAINDIYSSCSKISFLILFALSIPLATSILIYPRTHYLVMITPLCLLIGGILTDNCALSSQEASVKNFGYALMLCLSFAFFAAFATSRLSSTRPTYEVINALRSLDLPPLNILEASGGYHIYLGKGFNRVAEYDKEKDETCSAFIERKKVGLVIVEHNLLNDTRFKNIDDCQRLRDIAFPESDGSAAVAALRVAPNRSYNRILLIIK